MNAKIAAIILGIIGIGVFIYVVANNWEEKQTQTVSAEKVQVVTSFYPLYFLAVEIGGEHADVTNVTPAGVEPHDYEPTPRDLVAIGESDVLVFNGAGFEPWGADVLANLDGAEVSVVHAGEDLATLMTIEDEHGDEEEGEHEGQEESEEEEHEEGEEVVDPHVWLSPVLTQRMAEKIRDGFIAADPQNEQSYRTNTDALMSRLQNLDASFQTGLAQCERREIITSHLAFGYLAQAYDLTQIAISGLSTEEEPSAQQLAEVTKFAQENGVKYIFFETLVPADFSEIIATEVGAQTLVLNPLEGLTTEDIAAGKSYFTEMEANLANLKIALQCS